jgi:hypothetical protein
MMGHASCIIIEHIALDAASAGFDYLGSAGGIPPQQSMEFRAGVGPMLKPEKKPA